MSCCGKIVPGHVVGGKIPYTILFFFMSALAWIFRTFGDKILTWVPELKMCADGNCFGVLGVFRISFALAVFHVFMAILMIGVKHHGDFRAKIQHEFWLFKILIIAAMIFGSFFIPNSFFEGFGWVALVASGFFILVQLLLLVDFAHSWAENWIGKYEETMDESSKWWWILFGSSGFLYLLTIVLTILMYVFYCKDPAGCELNVTAITLNLVMGFFISCLAVHPKIQDANPRSGILQSGLICAYTSYLVWSAMMSEPAEYGCNPFANSDSASEISMAVGALFTIVAVCYSTIRAATSNQLEVNSETVPLTKEDKEEKTEGDESTAVAKEEKEEVAADAPVEYNFSTFHLIFALGSLYIAMLMSDWYTVDKQAGDYRTVDTGMAAVWVKMVSAWVSMLLYIWTLLAPVCFPDRDWGTNPETPW